MGNGVSRHPLAVLVVGLDGSGKTTIVNWFRANQSAAAAAKQPSGGNDAGAPAADTVPTVGFSARRIVFGKKKTPITLLDMSGQVGATASLSINLYFPYNDISDSPC